MNETITEAGPSTIMPAMQLPPEVALVEPQVGHPISGYGYNDLMRAPFQKPQSVVAGLTHQGHSAVLAGAFGQGKTYLGIQLSVNLAIGRDLLGRKVTRPYRTVFLDAENGKGEIKERVSQLVSRLKLSPGELANLNDNWRLEDFEDDGLLHWLNLATPNGFGKFEEYVKTHCPEVVIIDCFGKVYPKNEKDEECMKAFCGSLRKLTLRHECLRNGLILFLHHVTKFSAESASYNLLDHPWEFLARVRGSGRLLDLIPDRLAMELVSEGEPYHVVNGVLRSGTISPLILQRNETGFFELHDDKAFVEGKAFGAAPRRRELFRLIREQLGGRNEFAYKDVSALKGAEGNVFHNQTVTDTLRIACANGLLTQLPNSGYRLPSTTQRQ
jgi:hypothetical protein